MTHSVAKKFPLSFRHFLWGELFERCNIGFWPEDELDVTLGQRIGAGRWLRTGNRGTGQHDEQYNAEQGL